jgi:hypothetical protein
VKKSQGERILAHLKSGKTLSAKQAATMFGTYRLGARIMELREAGYKIDGVWMAERPHKVFKYWMTA